LSPPAAHIIFILEEAGSKLRQKYPDLAKTEQWNYFENLFYADYYDYMIKEGSSEMMNPADFDIWHENLEFSEKKNYKNFSIA
jgi:hypothetical protein